MRGELNRSLDSDASTEKVLDSLTKSGPYATSPENEVDPEKVEKDLNNPENPDRILSVEKKL